MKHKRLKIIRMLLWQALLLATIARVDAQTPCKLIMQVRDAETGSGLQYATCRVMTQQHHLLTYGISNEKGFISLNPQGKNLLLVFAKLGYQKKTIPLTEELRKKSPLIITLKQHATSLREVKIKAPPIERMHDTVTYNVAAFKGQEDNHLEDVLKKLPGIRVGKSGFISYQGKPISHFYVEGQDLLDLNYTQISKNLPINAVTQVQVLEHNQHLKVLKNKIFAKQAAINIKLNKKYKFRLFGEAEGGIGYAPLLWQNRLFLSSVGKKNQFVISGKMNNTGVNLETEVSDNAIHVSNSYEWDFHLPPSTGILSDGDLPTLPLSQVFFRHNNSGYMGINDLLKLSKNSNIKFNLWSYRDKSKEENTYENFYNGNRPFTLRTDYHYVKKLYTYLPKISYELNTNKLYIKNSAKASFTTNKNLQDIRENTREIHQNIHKQLNYFQNNMLMVYSPKKNLYKITSFVRKVDNQEMLNFGGDKFSREKSFRYNTRSFTLENAISSSRFLGGNAFNFDLRQSYASHDFLSSSLTRTKAFSIGTSPNYVWHYSDMGALNFSTGIDWQHTEIQTQDKAKHIKNLWLVLPELSWEQEFLYKFKFTVSCSYSKQKNLNDFYAAAPYHFSYRSIMNPFLGLTGENKWGGDASLAYKDMASMFFANLSASYKLSDLDTYLDYHYTQNKSSLEYKYGKNKRETLILNANADKTYSDARISFKTTLNYLYNKSLVSQNDLLFYNKYYMLSFSSAMDFRKIKWLNLTLNFKGDFYQVKNKLYKSDILSSYNSAVSMYILPISKLTLNVKYENYINEFEKHHYKLCQLFNIQGEYKLNNHWRFNLNLNNIFNYKAYSEKSFSGINSLSYWFPLRGRELICSASYNF